jgi:electron transfer DM13
MSRRVWIGVGLAIVLAGAWLVFRPELLFLNRTVSEEFPSTAPSGTAESQSPQKLLSGQFKGYAHDTDGMATIYETDNKRILRLTNFRTSNGPDVHVYLVAAPNVQDDATVKTAGFVDLGSMKGNVGDQNYDVPGTLDLRKYRAVTIWCKRFSINFGTAPLVPANE